MKTLRSGALLAFLLVSLIAGGCSDREKRPDDPPARRDTVHVYNDTLFHLPEFSDGRRLDTTLTADLDGDGRDEHIVTSIAPDSILPPGSRADRLQIFSYDPASRRHAEVLIDSLDWASSIELRDVTGDGLPELIVRTYAGGNDPVASNGLAIYSGDGGSIRATFKRASGDPVLARIENMQGEGVMVHEELWPDFAAHVDATEYLSEILAFRDGGYVSVRKEQRRIFEGAAEKFLKNYGELRGRFIADTAAVTGGGVAGTPATIDGVHPLFNPAALVMLSFGYGGDLRSLRSFWSSERDYLLARLPAAQTAELDAIYARMIAM